MKIYKKEIPASEDWKTDTDDAMINAFREVMAYNNQFQDDPEVGIFLYDVDEDELFGIKSATSGELQWYNSSIFHAPTRTVTALHYKVWNREYHRGKDSRFSGDYTMIPRGRVFEVKDRGYVVCVGSWIKDYPSAKQLILDEFQLSDDTEFMIDIHWELGHGWSDKDM